MVPAPLAGMDRPCVKSAVDMLMLVIRSRYEAARAFSSRLISISVYNIHPSRYFAQSVRALDRCEHLMDAVNIHSGSASPFVLSIFRYVRGELEKMQSHSLKVHAI